MLARMLARTPHPRRYPSTPVPSPFVFAHCHGRPSALRRFSMRMPPSPRVRNPPPPPPSPSSPPPLSQPQFPRFPHYPGRLPSNPVKLPDGTNYVRWFLALTLPFAAVSLFSGRTPLVSPPPLSSTAQQHARQRTPLLRLLAQGELRVAAELAWNRVVRGEAHARICHTLGHVPASGTSLEPGRPWHWWSYVTHQFIHGSLIHWGCSVFCLNAFFPMLAVAYGPGLAAAIGVACGAAASAADEALLYREAGLTSTTRRRDLDPIVEQKLVTPRVGASGSLMALCMSLPISYLTTMDVGSAHN